MYGNAYDNINCSTVHHKVTRFAFIRAYEVSKCVVEMYRKYERGLLSIVQDVTAGGMIFACAQTKSLAFNSNKENVRNASIL